MTLRLLAGLLAGVLLAACGVVSPRTTAATLPPAEPPPTLDAATAERLALAADDARRLAYRRADPGPLAALYTAPLLASEAQRLAGLAQRGAALEETVQQRRVVHLAAVPGRSEVVLSIGGQQRLSLPGTAPRPWTAFLRQSELELVWTGGSWLVDGAQDLQPDRWWK